MRRTSYYAIWLVVAALLAAASGSHADETPSEVEFGEAAIIDDDLEAALPHFEAAIQADPANAQAVRGRGEVYGRRSDYRAAIADFDRAIELDPADAKAHRLRGTTYGRMGDLDRAEIDLDRAIQLNPQDPKSYWTRGAVLIAKQQWRRAAADWTRVIELDPQETKAYAYRAVALGNAGELEGAMRDANRALEHNAQWVDAFHIRSQLYAAKEQWKEAEADLDRLIALDPHDVLAWITRGKVRCRLNNYDEALDDFSEAIRLDSNCADAFYNRALIYRLRKELDKALADSAELVRIAPDNLRFGQLRASLLTLNGKEDEAQTAFEEAIRHNPQSPCVYECRGAVRIRCGDLERGLADLAEAMRLNPGDAAANFEDWAKTPLDETRLAHGRQQLEQMLRDRPAMAAHGELAQPLYDWAARKFAGEDDGGMKSWSAEEPLPPFPSCYQLGYRTSISLSDQRCGDPASGENERFEAFWSAAVFELYNASNAVECNHLIEDVLAEKLTRREYIRRMLATESLAAEKTRSFFIHVFLPWAKEHGIGIQPSLWFLGHRAAPNELLADEGDEGARWKAYGYRFDLLTCRALTARGEFQKAIDLADRLLPQARTCEERCFIHGDRGWCRAGLGNQAGAIEDFNAVLQIDPLNAYCHYCRAAAYRALGDPAQALVDYDAILIRNPTDSEAYRLRGDAYDALGDTEHAQADRAMAERMKPLSGGAADGDLSQPAAAAAPKRRPQSVYDVKGRDWDQWAQELSGQPSTDEPPSDAAQRAAAEKR